MFVLALLTTGCQCGSPALPADSDPATPPTRPPPPPLDTAEEPQCDWVEIEPNNLAELANPLPLEAKACGNFDTPNGDSDNWAFEVPTTTWIGIDVEAEQRGSLANPAVVVFGEHERFTRLDDDEGADVSLLVPLAAGPYTLQLFEQNLSGGVDDRWFYDLQVSEQKAPRSWTGTADEPDDTEAEAHPVGDGAALYGQLDDETDEDWFRVDIPSGRHTLTLQVDAYSMGSPLDSELRLLLPGGADPGCPGGCLFRRGETGSGGDPWARYNSEGDETLYLRLRNEAGGGSPFHWYVLGVTLEGE